MGLEPDIREQELIAEALERRGESLSVKERHAETLVTGSLLVAAGALILIFPPAGELWQPLPFVGCLVALVFALRVEFDIASGWTVPSQLAFVPLLFTLPPSLAPAAVIAACVLSKLPDVVKGELRPVRLFRVAGSAWFAVGPALVLSATETFDPRDATVAILLGALAAQVVCDFVASAFVEELVHGASVREQLQESWVYAVDLALVPVGLAIAWDVEEAPWTTFGLLPLLGVIALFGRERRARVESLVELNSAYRGTALVLGDVVEADDGYTGEHCRDVVALALDVGRRLELGPERLRNLEFGALLHDVGKVAIPKDIINKPGKLDAREWEIVKTHTIEGQRMLDRVGGFMSDVGLIVRSHHERWDGGGYPDGLRGEEIPLEARIVTCCDTWNAMTTNRSYRGALPAHVAEQELRDCTGSQFDPAVVAALLAALAADGAVRRAGRESLPAGERVGVPTLA